MVDIIFLDFCGDFDCVCYGLRYVGENIFHFTGGFEPLLLGVEHTALVVHHMIGSEADESVVSFCIVFVDKVNVVGGNDFYAVFPCQFY